MKIARPNFEIFHENPLPCTPSDRAGKELQFKRTMQFKHLPSMRSKERSEAAVKQSTTDGRQQRKCLQPETATERSAGYLQSPNMSDRVKPISVLPSVSRAEDSQPVPESEIYSKPIAVSRNHKNEASHQEHIKLRVIELKHTYNKHSTAPVRNEDGKQTDGEKDPSNKLKATRHSKTQDKKIS